MESTCLIQVIDAVAEPTINTLVSQRRYTQEVLAASGDSDDKSEPGEEEEGEGSEPRTPSPAQRRKGADKDYDDEEEDSLKKGLKGFLHDKEAAKPEVSHCGYLEPIVQGKMLGMWCAVCFFCTSGRLLITPCFERCVCACMCTPLSIYVCMYVCMYMYMYISRMPLNCTL
jgi:hypothetical protein